jgi:hypothetical protein
MLAKWILQFMMSTIDFQGFQRVKVSESNFSSARQCLRRGVNERAGAYRTASRRRSQADVAIYRR